MSTSGQSIPLHLQLILAGLSNCAAACVTNPIDVVKVRLQLDGELASSGSRAYGGWVRGLRRIFENEGVAGFYKGLSASLMREASYSALRLGLYEPFKELFNAGDKAAPVYLKIAAGACSGCIGAALANPTDLVKIRLQADSSKRMAAGMQAASRAAGIAPSASQMGVLGTFSHIYRTEGGIGALWQGAGPNVARAALLTAAQVGSYDEIKNQLKSGAGLHEGLWLHAAASVCAGLIAAIVTAPVDTVKTRLMNQRAKIAAAASSGGAVGQPTLIYRNTLDCMWQTVRAEGPMALYKGFLPQWVRLGPHTIVTFLVYEELRRLVGVTPV